MIHDEAIDGWSWASVNFLECGGSTPLWSDDSRDGFGLVERFLAGRRQAAALQRVLTHPRMASNAIA